jgi:outer membrane lipoprotein-sorting protein
MTNQVKTYPIPIDQIAPLHISNHRKSCLSAGCWERDRGLARNGNTAEYSFRVLWTLLLFSIVLSASASAQSGSEVPTVKAIVERMGQARAENRARFRPYVVTRSYKVFGKEENKVKSQVIADIAFVPPNQKKYAIEESSGSGLGERAVRRILESEAKAAMDYDATDYSQANYDFHYIRDEQDAAGKRSYVLEMIPKREEKTLLRGKIWVDANTYRIHRFEGEPAESSSWWVRDVQMVFLYSDVDGMWLQTSTEATARVRILGPHRLVSNDLKYDISPLVATTSSTPISQSQVAGRQFQVPELADDRRELSLRKESLKWSSTKPYGSR